MIIKLNNKSHYIHLAESRDNKITRLQLKECDRRDYAPIVDLNGPALDLILNTLSKEDIKDILDSIL